MSKQRTVNMFAETNEDLPIFSGFALTQAAIMPPEYTPDGMDGYYCDCQIFINPTTSGSYRIQAYDNEGTVYTGYADTLDAAHAAVEQAIKEEYGIEP